MRCKLNVKVGQWKFLSFCHKMSLNKNLEKCFCIYFIHVLLYIAIFLHIFFNAFQVRQRKGSLGGCSIFFLRHMNLAVAVIVSSLSFKTIIENSWALHLSSKLNPLKNPNAFTKVQMAHMSPLETLLIHLRGSFIWRRYSCLLLLQMISLRLLILYKLVSWHVMHKKRRKWQKIGVNTKEKHQFLPLRLFLPYIPFDIFRLEWCCVPNVYVIFPFYLLFSCSTHLRHVCCVRVGETRETFRDISICCATLLEYVSSEMLSGNKQADNKRKCLKCTDNMPDGCLIPVTECSCISFVLL